MSNAAVTNLDCFPTELFLETFAYLDGYHIFSAFYGLNRRLTVLAYSCIVKHIDLRKTQPHEGRKVRGEYHPKKD